MDIVKDKERAREAQEWVEAVLGIKISGDFFEDIKDGVRLCELINKLAPGTCQKYKKSTVVFTCRANIQIYLKGCEKLGVPQTDRFETRDLYDQQNLDHVVNNIFALSAASRKISTFKGPYIGVKYSDKNVRNFSQEVLNKTKSSIPMWSRGDRENKSENIDGYGIIKGKNMDKHTGVLSTWEKGSLHTDKSGQHDSYGIVSVKGMDKHTGVQSTWEKGSLQTDKSSQHDSYGIVTVKGMDKHTGVQSTWEKGSLETDKSSQHDSYGIVSVKGMDKNTGVQSTWEKGSLETDKSEKQDSRGIIKLNE